MFVPAAATSADAAPPETTIASGPASFVRSTSAAFAFSSNQAGAPFACAVDGGAFADCASPFTLAVDWPRGPHLQLARSRRYLGHPYRLKAGVYTWYVWPGFGPLAKSRYGQLLGRGSFSIAG